MLHLTRINIDREAFPTEEHYPFNLKVMQTTKSLELNTAVTCFVGENGTGKSTLLEAVARRCNIHIWGEIERERAVKNPYEKAMYCAVNIEWRDGRVPGSFFASQTFRNYTKLIDEWAASDPLVLSHYGGKSLMTQSHGQSLMAYFRNRYKIKGIYFLDEPETALSPKTQVELLELVQEMSAAGHAQFLIVTHSPILLACPGATIYNFDTAPIETVAYEETEHFNVYRDFLTSVQKSM